MANFLQTNLVKALFIGMTPLALEKTMMLRDGSYTPIMGEVELILIVNGLCRATLFYLMQGFSPTCILGYPCLNSVNVLIDCRNKQLMINNFDQIKVTTCLNVI